MDGQNSASRSLLAGRVISGRGHRDSARASSLITAIWRYRPWLLGILDAVTVIGSFMLAYYIRFYLGIGIREVPQDQYSTEAYLKGAALLSGIWIFLMWRSDGYKAGLGQDSARMSSIACVVTNAAYALGLLMVISFMYRGLLLSRQVYLMTAVLGCCGMSLFRYLLERADLTSASRGLSLHRLVVVGPEGEVSEFARRLQAGGGLTRPIGFLHWDAARQRNAEGNPPQDLLDLGVVTNIRSLHETMHFDNVVLTRSATAHHGDPDRQRMIEIINFCEANGISLHVVGDSWGVAVTPREVGTLDGMPLIHLQDAPTDLAYLAAKRLTDVILAGLVLILGFPLWLLIAGLIKITSRGGGPVFFVQVRAGLHGRPFKIYKFRSMVVGAEEKLRGLLDVRSLPEPVFKIENDPRVTRAGRILRSTGLDEIPQLWNVLKGDMSLVGPRPEELAMVEKYDAWQRRRLKAKPGITGLQQISNRGEASLSRRIDYDLYYLKHRSVFLDIYILLKTVVVAVGRRGISC